MADENGQEARPQGHEPSLAEVTWRTLKSTRTTLYVLIAIAVVSTVGVVIPQGQPHDYYSMKYTDASVALITRLGLDRLYTSTIFYALIAILLLNLLACAGKAWRRALIQYRGPSLEAARRLPMTEGKALRSDLPSGELGDATSAALRRHGYRVVEQRGDDGEVLQIGLKHRFAAFGTILTHYSIFALAAGSILGSIAGTSLDTMFTVNEGQTFHDEKKNVDFDVTLNRFEMEYHEGDGSVSRYASDVSITRGGQTIASGQIAVNHPLKVGGVSLFQSNWGVGGFTVQITSPKGEPREVFIPLSDSMDDSGNRTWALPEEMHDRVIWLVGKQIALVCIDFEADAVVENGEVMGSMSEYPRKPAAMFKGISGMGQGTQHEIKDVGWLLADKPITFHGYKLKLGSVRKYSGLGVRRDMGLPLVWLGFIALMVGLVLQLYTQPRTALVSIKAHGKGAMASFSVRGGQVNRTDDDYRSLTDAISGKPEA